MNDPLKRDAIKDELDRQQNAGREDQAGGAWDEFKGKVKKTVGDLTDNASMEAEGRMQEAAGKLRKEAGELRTDAADKADDAL